MKPNSHVVVVIDGQGGRLGSMLVSGIQDTGIPCELIAVGTNAIATSAMIKAGAKQAATGENAVIVACAKADLIIGPIGIIVADALLGEITPAMAAAVGRANAEKLLLPVNLCNTFVIGVPNASFSALVSDTITKFQNLMTEA